LANILGNTASITTATVTYLTVAGNALLK
jgi:hypothetical protein